MTNTEHNARSTGTGRYVEVWSDTVSVRDLVISLIVVVTLTMLGYLVAPGEPPMPLVLGLLGALVGFAMCAVTLTPKREVKVGFDTSNDDGARREVD